MRNMAALRACIADDPGLRALREGARAEMDGDPGHDVDHAERVALWTLRIGGDDVNRREAIAAALLHDLVNLPKDSPERATAAERSAVAAAGLLAEQGFDEDATTRITQAIRNHSYSAGQVPRDALGRALQDADRLEALGALGILRTISTGSRMGARYFDPRDPFAAQRNLDDTAFSIDHFFKKLLGLASTMTTEPGRQEAKRRTQLLQTFLAELSHELEVPLPEPRCRK